MKSTIILSKLMNIKNNLSLIALIVAFLSFSSRTFSQKVDTTTYQNQQAYIYPFKQSCRASNYYYYGSKQQLKNLFQKTLLKEQKEKLSAKEFRNFKKSYKRQLRTYSKLMENQRKGIDDKLKKAIQKNPYPLLEIHYQMDKDVTPCLDKIPDGLYVQYFEDFPLYDEKGEYTIVSKKVAGVFSIKNNMLDGNAMWFNLQGDTLKKGKYSNGLKDGLWVLEERFLEERFLSKENKESYIKNGYPLMDTMKESITFSKGVKSGYYSKAGAYKYPMLEGEYENNEKSGSWIERKPLITHDENYEEVVHRDNKVVTYEYTLEKEPKIVKQPLIRTFLIDSGTYPEGFNMEGEYQMYNPLPSSSYEIAFEKKNKTMEEFDESSEVLYEEEYGEEYYGDEEYYEEEYYGEEEYYDEDYRGGSNYTQMVYDPIKLKNIKRGKAIDSVGIKFFYKGIYERHYPNGQLMFRYEFQDGKLLKEDTLFWDNGQPHDVITYLKDSAQYLQTIYDYDGKLYKEILYDHYGDFLRMKHEPPLFKTFEKDGLMVRDYPESQFFEYDKQDSIAQFADLDSVIIWKSWNREDTSLLYSRIYYPKERVLKISGYGATGKQYLDRERTYGETFDNWTGYTNLSFDRLNIKINLSASYMKSPYSYYKREADTVPILRVNYDNGFFDITEDELLYKDNQLYSGPASLSLNAKKALFSTEKNIDFKVPIKFIYATEFYEDFLNYKTSGESNYKACYDLMDEIEISEGNFDGITYSVFGFLKDFIQEPDQYNEMYYDEEYYEGEEDEMEEPKESRPKDKDLPLFSKKITGNFKDGKPSGVWKIEDQYGRLMFEIPFIKGEIEGELKAYSVAQGTKKKKKENFYEYGDEMDRSLYDAPKKETHYLSSVTHYKSGQKEGEFIMYNWNGEIIQHENYKEGELHGPALERNKLAYTKSNYEEGALDGYVQTYLTLAGRDTTLLYSLNFQNGLLQGESKSFHLNGRISKRGFFLNGQPIDDYEAYDSLGTKYHYVKFQYSYPVEEKIWEENQLSIRYTFDWKDSIFFRPSDITTSQTLDRVLAEHGIGMEYFNRPYYGRPSLISKSGVNYHLTKYYSNDTIARDGELFSGKKKGCWKFYNYYGKQLYDIDYFDTVIKLNDSISFNAKGIYEQYDTIGKNIIFKAYIVEKYEKYDCSHSDHYEIRQFYVFWENPGSKILNGYVKHHYDNGVLQSEGSYKNGLPDGIWKFYDPYGKLNQVGMYIMGKRDGRWLGGDLSKTKYLGDICLNPNLPDLEETIKMREKQLDITITYYKLGKAMNKEFYDVDWSRFDEEGKEDEEIEETEE